MITRRLHYDCNYGLSIEVYFTCLKHIIITHQSNLNKEQHVVITNKNILVWLWHNIVIICGKYSRTVYCVKLYWSRKYSHAWIWDTHRWEMLKALNVEHGAVGIICWDVIKVLFTEIISRFTSYNKGTSEKLKQTRARTGGCTRPFVSEPGKRA